MANDKIHEKTPQIKYCSMPFLIESITGVWKFHRTCKDISHALSLPGHLFHYIISGKYHLTTNGREYDVKPGDVIYYHEVEDVTVDSSGKPVTFYSIGFLTPHWPALPLSMRVFPGGKDFEKLFEAVYKSFIKLEKPINQARLFANLYKLIELIELRRQKVSPSHQIIHSLWWEVENTIIRNRNFHASIDELTEIAAVSNSGLNRICKMATGLSPKQRIMQLRMNHAQGLLKHSSLSITQIARYLGYSRINEFSREYQNTFRISPRKTRKI